MTLNQYKLLAAPILAGIARQDCAIQQHIEYPGYYGGTMGEHQTARDDMVRALKELAKHFRKYGERKNVTTGEHREVA